MLSYTGLCVYVLGLDRSDQSVETQAVVVCFSHEWNTSGNVSPLMAERHCHRCLSTQAPWFTRQGLNATVHTHTNTHTFTHTLDS